jgi:hypothetical protein
MPKTWANAPDFQIDRKNKGKMVFLRDKWYLRQFSRAPLLISNKYIHDDEATLGH